MLEEELLNIVNTCFDLDLHQTDRFAVVDGIDHYNQVLCEVKTRNCKKNKFNRSMIGANKIKYAERNFPTYDFLIVLEYTDGIYYYLYNKYDDHKVKISGYKNGIAENRPYYFIHKDLWEKLCLDSKYEIR
tara:strand:- start:1300 stop:1692 length:393 start_codon:yes stop_codon:yes gene_type:complete